MGIVHGWRLNPFEFRAGLKQRAPAALALLVGLNPFEFRAGLKLSVIATSDPAEVLIPLNSGLA